MDDERTEIDEHPLSRRADERPERHRAWLLWLAQDPDQRSWRLVSRAVGRDESTIRGWRSKHKWNARTKAAGEGAQAMALAMYRRDYLARHGRLELEAIRGACSLDLAPGDPPQVALPESVVHGNADPAQGTKKAGNPQGTAPRRQSEDEKAVRKGLVLADAAIATFAREVAAGKVTVRPRDLPFLVQFRRQLQRDVEILEAGEAGQIRQGPAVIPESYRVKTARATGGDVLEAIHDDAEDLVTLLRAVRNQRRANATPLAPAAGGADDG